jgi:hypothetical protein
MRETGFCWKTMFSFVNTPKNLQNDEKTKALRSEFSQKENWNLIILQRAIM